MNKSLVKRPTALGVALAAAAAASGIPVDEDRLPVKRESSWSVTRKGPRKRRRR